MSKLDWWLHGLPQNSKFRVTLVKDSKLSQPSSFFVVNTSTNKIPLTALPIPRSVNAIGWRIIVV